MIEFCNFRHMVLFIILLICSCIIIVAVEGFLTPPQDNSPQPSAGSENTSGAPCWQNEQFTVKQHCAPCTEFEKVSKHLPACVDTGFKELVACQASGDVYRSCKKVLWLEERKFWIFESLMTLSGMVSALMVVLRQKHLNKKMLERIQRQIAAGV